MSYVHTVLLPGETIIITARLHWIIYRKSILLFVGGSALFVLYLFLPGTLAGINSKGVAYPTFWPLLAVTGTIYLIALLAFMRAWFVRWNTEFAVTRLRIIYKTGFIRRRTVEMNMDKVESVHVHQSMFGRFLGYGTLHVLGVGQGIEHLNNIATPIKIRTAIIASEGEAAAQLQTGKAPASGRGDQVKPLLRLT